MAYILHKCEEYKVIESIQYDSINYVRLIFNAYKHIFQLCILPLI